MSHFDAYFYIWTWVESKHDLNGDLTELLESVTLLMSNPSLKYLIILLKKLKVEYLCSVFCFYQALSHGHVLVEVSVSPSTNDAALISQSHFRCEDARIRFRFTSVESGAFRHTHPEKRVSLVHKTFWKSQWRSFGINTHTYTLTHTRNSSDGRSSKRCADSARAEPRDRPEPRTNTVMFVYLFVCLWDIIK